jgi:hypothetical protein
VPAYNGVEFEVREIQPGRWLWIIQTPDRPIIAESRYRCREAAIDGCINEISNRAVMP